VRGDTFQVVRWRGLLACIAAAALAATPAAGRPEEPPQPASPAPAPPPEPPPSSQSQPSSPPPSTEPEPPPEALPGDEDTFLDVGHALVQEKLFAPVLYFDRFFSDERDLEVQRERSFARWRNELRLDPVAPGGVKPHFAMTLHADLRMPGLNRFLRRLRLVIEGEGNDIIASGLPDPEAQGTGNAELRYDLWSRLLAHSDLGAGVLFRLPPGVYTRVRLRAATPLGGKVLGRAATSVFWRTDWHLGTSAMAYLERPVGDALLLRGGVTGLLTQRSRGLEWLSELAALAKLGSRSAVYAVGGLRGYSSESATVDRYFAATRFRRDFWRRWLFFELEPQVYWPWRPVGERLTTYAVIFRLEVQLHASQVDQEGTAPDTASPGADDLRGGLP
jgi:hypothetical protein